MSGWIEPDEMEEPQWLTRMPRRSKMGHWIEAEKAINQALIEVEKLGAHPDLTAIVMQLAKAKTAVADWYDGDRLGANPEFKR